MKRLKHRYSQPFSPAGAPLSKAFTLSEVLITLGVIGVVAAMTIMVMVKDHQQKVLATQLEKAKSVVANGYRLMAARQGVMEFSDLSFWDCQDFACMQREHQDIFQVVYDASHLNFSLSLMPELNNAAWADTLATSDYKNKLTSEEIEIAWKDCKYAFMTPDGFIMGVTRLNYDTRKELYVIVDVNSRNNPNSVKEDLYVLKMDNWTLTEATDEYFGIPETPDEEPLGGGGGGSSVEPPIVDNDEDKDKDEDKDEDKDNNGNNGNGNGNNKKPNGAGYGSNNGKGNGAQNQNGNGHGNWDLDIQGGADSSAEGSTTVVGPSGDTGSSSSGSGSSSSGNTGSTGTAEGDYIEFEPGTSVGDMTDTIISTGNSGNNGNGNGNNGNNGNGNGNGNNGNNGNGNGNNKDKNK